jgi:outer membrane protein insertion porin family
VRRRQCEVGDDYTDQMSKEIISSLYKTQFFKDIEVSEVNQTLKITVIENPHIKYIDLLKLVSKTNLRMIFFIF